MSYIDPEYPQELDSLLAPWDEFVLDCFHCGWIALEYPKILKQFAEVVAGRLPRGDRPAYIVPRGTEEGSGRANGVVRVLDGPWGDGERNRLHDWLAQLPDAAVAGRARGPVGA